MTSETRSAPAPVRLVTRFVTDGPQAATRLVGLLEDGADDVAREPGPQDYDVRRAASPQTTDDSEERSP